MCYSRWIIIQREQINEHKHMHQLVMPWFRQNARQGNPYEPHTHKHTHRHTRAQSTGVTQIVIRYHHQNRQRRTKTKIANWKTVRVWRWLMWPEDNNAEHGWPNLTVCITWRCVCNPYGDLFQDLDNIENVDVLHYVDGSYTRSVWRSVWRSDPSIIIVIFRLSLRNVYRLVWSVSAVLACC